MSTGEGIKEYDRIVYSAKSKGKSDQDAETQREEGKIGDNIVKINTRFKAGDFKKFIEEELPTTSQLSKSRKEDDDSDLDPEDPILTKERIEIIAQRRYDRESCPWLTPEVVCDDPWIQLHNEMISFYKFYGP